MLIEPLNFIALEPPALRRGDPDTTVWTDNLGTDVAYGATRGGWHWLRVAGAGSYRFPANGSGRNIVVDVVPENEADLVVDSFYRTVVPMALQAYGHEILHGSAVALAGETSGGEATGGQVVAMCAAPGTGKSTIAFAMQRRGARAVADDAVVIRRGEHGEQWRHQVQPLPFALRLREASADHFASPAKSEVLVGRGAAVEAPSEPLPLAAVVLLERGESSLTLTPLSAADAFPALLSQSYAFTMTDGRRKRAMMANFIGLARTVPVYRLAYPSGLEHLDAICAAMEGLMRAAD